MAITEEQYEQITDELNAYDFDGLADMAVYAGIPSLHQELDDLYEHAKRALLYAFDEDTEQSLETLFNEVDELSGVVTGAIDALERIDGVLSKAETVLGNALFADDDDID